MARNKDNTSNGDVSIFSSGVKIEGKIFSEGNVRIDGSVKGDITVEGNLTLGDSSDIDGKIEADNITANGIVKGKITASGKLVLEPKSRTSADIVAKILVVEEGAIFDGKSVMSNGPGVTADAGEEKEE